MTIQELRKIIYDKNGKLIIKYEGDFLYNREGEVTIIDGIEFEMVYRQGGREGDGEHVERVYSAGGKLWSHCGRYSSYDGSEYYTDEANPCEVKPEQKMITVYNPV